MPSLLDIAPPEITAEEIDIRGTKLRVFGIVAEQWAALYSRFPELRALVAGQPEGLSAMAMFAGQAALIATGLGSPGDDEMEHAVMDRLTTEEQNRVVETIIRLSLPGHVFRPLLNGAAHSAAGPATAA